MTDATARRQTKLLLGRKMTLVVAGIAVLLASCYLIVGVWFARIQLEREFHENAELVGATLVSSLTESILTQNVYQIPDLLESAQNANKVIAYAFVCDSEGNPVAYSHSFKQGVPGDLQKIAWSAISDHKAVHSKLLRSEQGDIYHLIFPLQGNPGGYLHLGFSMAQLDSELHDTLARFIASMLMGLLLSVLVGGLVYRSMAQPISHLIQAAENFGEGDLTSRVVFDSRENDEVSLMALAFNRMADQLQEKLSELEHSRADLADEKTRVQAILDGMMHGVIFYQPDGILSYGNRAAKKHWGLNEESPIDSRMRLREDHVQVSESIKRILAGQDENYHTQLQSGNRTLDVSVSGIRRENGDLLGVVEISADITEEINYNRALAHAEKINIVGQLAAGVAHEINSPLDGAIEAARIMETGEMGKGETRSLAKAQRAALERIAIIVKRLLTFSRKEQALKKPLAIWPVITEALEMVKYRIARKGISIEMPEPSNRKYIIEGEELELSQVMVNLLNNAVDANPEGGWIKINVSCAPGELVVSITDRGPGIPDQARDRVFTPFFTTKDVGKGTGLGLAISKNIVEQYGGRITFSNEEPPWGATFSVHLPWNGKCLEENEHEGVRDAAV